MREFFKSTRFKILLAFIAFLIGIMIYAVTKGGYAVSGASFINTVTKPLRYLSNGFSTKIETIIDRYENADFYYNQSQELQKKVNDLNQQIAEYEDLKEEVEELQKLVVMKKKHPDSVFSQPAEVMGYIANDPFKSFTIDLGSDDGITPYCPVTTEEGIVGIVIEVSQYTSTVRTILSPDLSIASVCSSTSSDFGITEGSVITAKNNMTKLTHLSIDHEIKENDLIITSGSSGIFPKDIPIGTVKSTGVEPNGLTAYAEIEPCTDISRLHSVFVITDFKGKKETENAAENTP